MNSPILNNFTVLQKPRPWWRRFFWLITLVIIAVVGTGWYITKHFLPLTPTTLSQTSETVPAATPKIGDKGLPVYTVAEASKHIGETAQIRGTVLEVHISDLGNAYLNFCNNIATCPFYAYLYAKDVPNFRTLTYFEGKTVLITGIITAYKTQTVIHLTQPSQIQLTH